MKKCLVVAVHGLVLDAAASRLVILRSCLTVVGILGAGEARAEPFLTYGDCTVSASYVGNAGTMADSATNNNINALVEGYPYYRTSTYSDTIYGYPQFIRWAMVCPPLSGLGEGNVDINFLNYIGPTYYSGLDPAGNAEYYLGHFLFRVQTIAGRITTSGNAHLTIASPQGIANVRLVTERHLGSSSYAATEAQSALAIIDQTFLIGTPYQIDGLPSVDLTAVYSTGTVDVGEWPNNFYEDSITRVYVSVPASVPEPSTFAIALAGLACRGFSMRRQRRRRAAAA